MPGEDTERVPLPDGTYRLSGIVGAQALDVQLEVAGEQVRVSGPAGSCRTHIDYDQNRGRTARSRAATLSCGSAADSGMRVTLAWDQDGRVNSAHGQLPVTEMVRKRGECKRWSTGVSPTCLEYEWTTEPVTRWASGRLAVAYEGDSGGSGR